MNTNETIHTRPKLIRKPKNLFPARVLVHFSRVGLVKAQPIKLQNGIITIAAASNTFHAGSLGFIAIMIAENTVQVIPAKMLIWRTLFGTRHDEAGRMSVIRYSFQEC